MKEYPLEGPLQDVADKINLPTCAVCMENLGTYGGPASLACGHNGCLKCLQELQTHLATPLCPLCRTPFNSKLNLRLNFDLKDTLERMQTTSSAVRYVGSEANPLRETNGQHKTSMEGQNRYEALRDLAFPEEADPWVRVSLTQRGKKECLSSFDHTSQEGNTYANRDPGATLPEHSAPEVNLRNVLSGLYTIITGGNLSHPEPEEQHDDEASSELSSEEFIQNDTATLYSGPDLPSAPPLPHLEGNDNLSVPTIFETEPPHWIPDSAASCCMHCGAAFMPLVCGRHHCRFCGGIFCRACSRGKCLLPVKFRERDPQRVCDSCYERLEPLQRFLLRQVSNAAQIAKHDVMDWTCMRGWVNTPLGLSMEQEIYKSGNVLRSYCQIARLKPDRSIPVSVLRGANGLAIFTVAKVGIGITYKLGTGIVIARRENGSWSAPSAIASFGLGWGAQMGGELTDFVIVLRNFQAVKAFSSRVHFSLGGGLSVAAGPLGRVLEADLRAGDEGTTSCYTYSSSKGAFLGVSLEGNIVTARTDTNMRFYGDPYLTPTDILFGSVERPRAAEPLYNALHDLFQSLGKAI